MLLFQFHIQLFLNYFTLVNRETMMYYAKEFRILQLRRIITRWCCRIIQVLGYSTQRFRNAIIQVFRVKLQFLCRFNYLTIKIIEFESFAEVCLRTIRQRKLKFCKNAKIFMSCLSKIWQVNIESFDFYLKYLRFSKILSSLQSYFK